VSTPLTALGPTEAALLPAHEAAGLAAAWDDLTVRSLEPNVFLARWMVEARLRHLPDRTGARLLVAWRGEGEARRLVGLAPLVRPRGRHFSPFPVLRAAELYAPLSTPLLDPERPAETWAAMLAALKGAGIVGLVLPFLGAEGAAAAALREATTGSGLRLEVLGAHRRAFLRSPLSGRDYLRASLVAKRRKEADRQRRRLAELGPLHLAGASTESDVAAALEGFLALEASGWKGRSGTDLATAPGAAAFFRDAGRAGAGMDAFRIVSLTSNGRVLAAGLVAIAGRRAFYVKTAYDEAFARHSPGFLLTLDLTTLLLDDPSVDDADSVALSDHPMIDRIWTARFAVESVFVATGAGSVGGALALAVERGREAAWKAGRAARDALRRGRADGS
jgi:CelD/BcsL family acetyltransferase involved in cellulose biosynthesis